MAQGDHLKLQRGPATNAKREERDDGGKRSHDIIPRNNPSKLLSDIHIIRSRGRRPLSFAALSMRVRSIS
jgi:hypothetical protein